MERISQAIILAAGEGQRLRPLTALMPKVMIRIGGKPIVQYVLEALAENGIRRIVMVVGYQREQVQDYFGSGQDFGVEIEYVFQPQQIGTAHALRQAADLADERFLIVCGDNMIEADTIESLVNSEADAMLVTRQEDVSRYGVVLERNGKVSEVLEKPVEKAGSMINTGAYAFGRHVFDFIDDEVRLTAVVQKMIDAGHEIAVCRTEGLWQDAAYPWDILKLNDICLKRVSPSLGGTVEDGAVIKGAVSIGDGTVIRSNCYIVGPVIIGEDCEIGPGVCIFPSTSIGTNVVISPFSVIRNSIVQRNTSLGPGSSITDSVIAYGTTASGRLATQSGEAVVLVEGEHHRVKMGAIIGSYCKLGESVVALPGVFIGNNCQIKSMRTVGESVPDNALVV